jgi:hypothetical protein
VLHFIIELTRLNLNEDFLILIRNVWNFLEREIDGKGRTLIYFTIDLDPSMVGGCDPISNTQTQTHPTGFP